MGRRSRLLHRALHAVGRLVSASAYVLDGGDAVLVWSAPFATRGKRRAEMERFVGAIAARGGQPLRDLSSLAASLAISNGKPLRLRALGVPTEPLGLPELDATPSRRGWPFSRGATTLGIVALALLVAVGGTGVWLQQYQPAYRASFPALLHAEHPLYADAFSADDGAWHPAAGTIGGHGQFTFGGGAYQLGDPLAAGSGDTTSIGAWAPGDYGDAAVEVTASQTGSSQDDGVGLVVRADASGDRQLAFTVDTTGNWAFSDYHNSADGTYWGTIDSGQSSVAHLGDGAPNTLLLIMRGDSYLYFLNGQLVGSYTDSYIATPRSGRAGVVVLDGTTSGAFNNFAVYPVQPLSSFLWV